MPNHSDHAASSTCVSFNHLNCTGPSLPPLSRHLVLALLLIFIAATVLGNLLIIAAIASFRQLQTRANALALSLAVSDLLVGILCMPSSTLKTIYNCWFFPDVLCHWHFFADYMFTTASVLHVTCIAFDRYVAISDPLRYAARVTPRTLVAMLAFCWLGSALVSSPILLSLSDHEALSGPTIHRILCPNDCFFYISIGTMLVIGMGPYFASMLVVVAVYARIYAVARGQARRIAASASGSQVRGHAEEAANSATVKNLKREHNATKTLGAIICSFLLSWLPFYIITIVSMFVNDMFLSYRVTLWLGYISSIVNPFLYALLNRQFRSAFRTLLSVKVFSVLGSRGDDFMGVKKS
ncbi:trace amine-associated receptor 365-like [Petromyzon marinus]|uniref:trace amine-associated receptor 365-like n=1 Tax=Petromyzon marinus TaxID=7757 RepID=UPI003F6F556A